MPSSTNHDQGRFSKIRLMHFYGGIEGRPGRVYCIVVLGHGWLRHSQYTPNTKQEIQKKNIAK